MRSLLRAQARAVDVAEAASDPEAVTHASAVYLTCLESAGLTPTPEITTDVWAELVAELGRPTSGGFHAPQP